MANSFFNKLTSSLNVQKEEDGDATDFYRALDEAQDQDAAPQEEQQPMDEVSPSMPDAMQGESGAEEEPEDEGEGGVVGLDGDNPETAVAHLAMARPSKGAVKERSSHRVLAPLAMAEDDAEGQLAIDVYQTDSHIVIKSVIAGVQPEDLDITIGEDTVTIRGSRKKDEKVSNENYFYQECYWGAFSRSVILPVEIDREHAEASFKNGILTIRLPKLEKNRTKKIHIAME